MNKQPQATIVHKNKPTISNRVLSARLAKSQLTSIPQPVMAGVSSQLRPQDLLRLQRTVGNRAVQRLINNRSQVSPGATTELAPESEGEGQEEEVEEEQVELDLNEDGEIEEHTLQVDQETGQLMIHSDPDTLEHFLEKYEKKLKTPQDQKILLEIKQAAEIVHIGRYGTKYLRKGYTKTKGPTVGQRGYVKPQLKLITKKLKALSIVKGRPHSHVNEHVTRVINGDTFCEKIVMEPLSIRSRDDNIEGSHPHEETQLWRSLTNFAKYKRGHMLNDHLHGPGSNDNLVPISTAFNATMREGVEKVAKTAVNSQNKVVRFEAEAQNWGQFPGAFGFPEERELPNKFHFKVELMKKKMGAGNGSQIGDWETTGRTLYEATPTHDVPADVIPGVVSPVVKTFIPGLYYCPFGTVKRAGTNFHLKGSFNINTSADKDVLVGLGIDEKANLQSERIDETVVTEYQLPPGYGYKLLLPTEIEYVYFDKLFKYTTPDRAFVIYNRNEEMRLKQEHQAALDDFKEQQRILSQQKRTEEQNRKLAEKQRETERRQQEDERKRFVEAEKKRQEQNDAYRHRLYAQIRNEMAKYVDEFGQAFEVKREEALYFAKQSWQHIPNLIDRDMNELLAPVREEIEISVTNLRMGLEKKDELQAELLNQYKQLIEDDGDYSSQLVSAEAKREFRANAITAYERRDAEWERLGIEYWAKMNFSYFWDPLHKEVEKILSKAKEWDGDSKSTKVISALTKRYEDAVRDMSLELYGKVRDRFKKQALKRYNEYKTSWEKRALDTSLETLWRVFEQKLQSDLNKTQEFFNKDKVKEERALKEWKRDSHSERSFKDEDRENVKRDWRREQGSGRNRNKDNQRSSGEKKRKDRNEEDKDTGSFSKRRRLNERDRSQSRSSVNVLPQQGFNQPNNHPYGGSSFLPSFNFQQLPQFSFNQPLPPPPIPFNSNQPTNFQPEDEGEMHPEYTNDQYDPFSQ